LKESDPASYIHVLSRSLYFQDTLCARPTLGSRETIEGITKDDLISYHNKMLTSGRAVIVISGGISLNTAVSTLESTLKIRESERFKPLDCLPKYRKTSILTREYKANDLIHLALGFRACDCFSEDAIPLIFLGNILGGGMASRLRKKLRSDTGYVYGVAAGYGGSVDRGVFSVHTRTAKKHLQEVLSMITDELETIVTNGVFGEELEFTKNRSIKSKKGTMQTSGSWVGFHDYDELIDDPRKTTLPEYQVAALTTDDIKRVSKRYLTKNSWYLAMCGDIREDEVTINY
jgi:predicted Zn-dependent peptidase